MKMSLQITKTIALLVAAGITHSVHSAATSTYIKVDGAPKVKQIRFSDHEGHKVCRNSWQVRTDRNTQRKLNIFNHKDMQTMSALLSIKLNLGE